VSPEVALKIGGWRSNSMLQRYGIINSDDMAEGIKQMEEYRALMREKEQAARKKVVVMR
jgi:hypothetical protein